MPSDKGGGVGVVSLSERVGFPQLRNFAEYARGSP